MRVLLWFLIRQLYDADAGAVTFAKTQGRGTTLTPWKNASTFSAPLDLGLKDAFAPICAAREKLPVDYREFAFRRNLRLRIDYILVSNALNNALEPAVTSCLIDKLPREAEHLSDHAPVLAELELL